MCFNGELKSEGENDSVPDTERSEGRPGLLPAVAASLRQSAPGRFRILRKKSISERREGNIFCAVRFEFTVTHTSSPPSLSRRPTAKNSYISLKWQVFRKDWIHLIEVVHFRFDLKTYFDGSL